jgi:hypothetical protein
VPATRESHQDSHNSDHNEAIPHHLVTFHE